MNKSDPYPKISPVKPFIDPKKDQPKSRKSFWATWIVFGFLGFATVLPQIFPVKPPTSKLVDTDQPSVSAASSSCVKCCPSEPPPSPAPAPPAAPPVVPPIVSPEPAPAVPPAPAEPEIKKGEELPLVSKTGTDLSKIKETRKFYFSAFRNDKKIELRTGGSITWRYNNPSRLLDSGFSRKMGAIGDINGVAVFPSYTIGRAAASAYLFGGENGNSSKTIAQAFKPASASKISKALNISSSTILKQLSENKRSLILDIIQEEENFIPGKVTLFDDLDTFERDGW